jgi:hypothetical protein
LYGAPEAHAAGLAGALVRRKNTALERAREMAVAGSEGCMPRYFGVRRPTWGGEIPIASMESSY